MIPLSAPVPWAPWGGGLAACYPLSSLIPAALGLTPCLQSTAVFDKKVVLERAPRPTVPCEALHLPAWLAPSKCVGGNANSTQATQAFWRDTADISLLPLAR